MAREGLSGGERFLREEEEEESRGGVEVSLKSEVPESKGLPEGPKSPPWEEGEGEGGFLHHSSDMAEGRKLMAEALTSVDIR